MHGPARPSDVIPLRDHAAPQAPSPDAASTDLFDAGTSLDPTRRIFVNRNLRLDQIHLVGFDMDYTLARYVKRAMEALSFRLTAERLVERLGYPEEILRLEYDPSFVIRGLAVDKRLGNILKMDGHNHVGRVHHGRRALTRDERKNAYRSAKVRLSASRYHWIDTLFALPEAQLFADIIDLYETELGVGRVAYWKLFDDIRNSIDECHRDGTLKAIVKADLGSFIHADPLLPSTLHKLRSAGKRLFVLTNSYWDYTDAVMSFLLDGKLGDYPRWINFFDFVVVGAEKPKFFQTHNPFLRLNPLTGEAMNGPVTRLEPRGVYQGGSIGRLDKLIGDAGEHVLYVGDHIYGDIIRSKRSSLWRTALILEELEDEILLARTLDRTQADVIALEEHRTLLDHEITHLKLRLGGLDAALSDAKADPSPEDREPPKVEELADTRRKLRMSLDRKRRDLRATVARRDQLAAEIERHYNPYWGSSFKEGREVSRFGAQVEDYACVYTSRVSNFLCYSPQQYFRAPRHWMSHEKI
ncbi:MAG: HAD-IG family 5'-nucleotidase [Deltaproteobacteria bacterium]|nr:HAD-IG family 5'-nucleotidase [Deltaproteobacteria bacterium]